MISDLINGYITKKIIYQIIYVEIMRGGAGGGGD